MSNELVYREAKELLVDYFKRNIKDSKDGVCNSKTWMFAIKHSLRVEDYSIRIAESIDNLSKEDILTVRLASIFHDIGSVVQRKNHAEISSKIIEEIFDEIRYISQSGIDKNRLVRIIADHSNKERVSDDDILSTILKDADILDQIGAMSILMHSSKYQYDSFDFYGNILKELQTREMSFCDEAYSLLRTNEGKRIMDDKIKFINSFRQQLECELSGELKNSQLF